MKKIFFIALLILTLVLMMATPRQSFTHVVSFTIKVTMPVYPDRTTIWMPNMEVDSNE